MKAIAHATVRSAGVRYYRHDMTTGAHALVADESVALGGGRTSKTSACARIVIPAKAGIQ
jgi:hypothetical protein